MTPQTLARIDRLDRLATNLDSRYRLPLTNIRFGWDAILGLVPGIGDVAALAPAAYIWLEAHRLGASNGVKLRMAGNTGLDLLVGSIPIVGDIFDVGIRANRRNVDILRTHLDRETGFDKDRELPDKGQSNDASSKGQRAA